MIYNFLGFYGVTFYTSKFGNELVIATAMQRLLLLLRLGEAKLVRLDLKQIGGRKKVKLRGLEKVEWLFVFTCAAFNLLRIPKLRENCA